MTETGALSQISQPVQAAESERNRIVVGHDGSDDVRALTVAMELAERLSAAALIVRAWSILTVPHPLSWEFGTWLPWPSCPQWSALV